MFLLLLGERKSPAKSLRDRIKLCAAVSTRDSCKGSKGSYKGYVSLPEPSAGDILKMEMLTECCRFSLDHCSSH
jgi:hypothetical protein